MPRIRPKTGSFWSRTLDSARLSQTWTVVPRRYNKRTAMQLACDLRSAQRRSALDIAGVKPGEKWDAVWEAPEGSDADWNCVVAIKYLGDSNDVLV